MPDALPHEPLPDGDPAAGGVFSDPGPGAATQPQAPGIARSLGPTGATWGLRQILIAAVAVPVLLFAVEMLIVLPVAGGFEERDSKFFFATLIATIIWQIGYVALVVRLVHGTGGTLDNLGLRLPERPRDGAYAGLHRFLRSLGMRLPVMLVTVIAGYLACYLAVTIYVALISLAGLDALVPDAQLPEELFDSTAVIIVAGVSIIVAAPIAEEILFRGFLFGGLRTKLPFLPAGLIAGALFSLAHGILGLIVPFALIGVILAYTFERTRSLLPGMAIH